MKKQKFESLRDLLVDQLRDLYSAEQQLVEALPKMAEAATSEDLRQAFEVHLDETKVHVERLEAVLKRLKESPKGKVCAAMQGLIKEGEETIEMQGDNAVRDAALIAAAQRVEHYEIAGYGTARTFARVIGEDELADILQETLDEEGETDHELTAIAEGINSVASD